MTAPKYATYELKLSGDEDVVAFIKQHLPTSFPTIAAANAKRRAVLELFGDEVGCEVVSVRRIPARVKRRVLRL